MADEAKQTPGVYAAIRSVMQDMAKAGVGKLKHNVQQSFTYRGVDDVMDALAPSLAKHGLIIVPHVEERTSVERESRNGGKLFHTLLKIDYDFIAVADGSMQHVGPIYGEAMDSGDKATNKAMAIAYKYACVQTFCIPITGDDPDADSHQVAGGQEQSAATAGSEATPQSSSGKPPPVPPAPHAPRPEIPLSHDGKPRVLRPTGLFGYGKKFYETPWSVMTQRDLVWFRDKADRTPPTTLSQIEAELAWRQYETSQLDAADEREREALNKPFDDEIP